MIALLAITIAATPLISFAKENDKKDDQKGRSESSKGLMQKNNNDDDRDDDNDNKNRKNGDNKNHTSCVRAYGHLFAFGWNKKNSLSDDDRAYISGNCYLPFGIAKKFRGYNATTTPDVTAPVISNLSTNAGKTQADIRWSTNEQSDSVVFWNTSSSVDTSNSATNKVSNNRLTKGHQVLLRNLTPDTTYYVIVRSRDAAGNQTLSTVTSFKTKAPSADNQLPIISNVVTLVSTSTVQVGWKTSENTTDRVYYSTTLPVTINASTTAYVSNASLTKNHGMTITGLAANTTYYLVIESTDTAGNVSTSATFSAKTNALAVVTDTTAPIVSSIGVVAGASTSTVSWTTNELSTSKVFYSTITPLDISTSTTQSVLNGSLVTSHSVSLSGLATSTVYYFKVQSVDAAGNTQTSGEFTATTLAQ